MKSLLLDTEALIWWDANDPRLGGKARSAIQDAPEVYVSAASAWEIAIKTVLGKLRTSRRLAKAVEDGGFLELPVSFAHAEGVQKLPKHHSDPFDRLIISTARAEQLTVVTSDAKFRSYEVEVIDATA
jgi:PIN domain nuclease of toxin-antitoxin system